PARPGPAGPAHPAHSTRMRLFPSGSRRENMGGASGIRMTSGSASTPRARRSAWSPSASVVIRRMPAGTPSGTRAMGVADPGGGTPTPRPHPAGRVPRAPAAEGDVPARLEAQRAHVELERPFLVGDRDADGPDAGDAGGPVHLLLLSPRWPGGWSPLICGSK